MNKEKLYTLQNKCPVTGDDGDAVFSFSTPLAGGFLRSKSDIDNEVIYPLTLSFYKKSSLLMVNERIPSEILFKNYFYKSGSSLHLTNHFLELSEKIKSNLNPKKVLEIGCNDFTLLKFLKKQNTTILGVDPSDISKTYCTSENELINTFFNFNLSKNLRKERGLFDLIISTNSFAHIDDIVDAAKGVENLLDSKGTFIVEVHWLKSLIENYQFPFIYHEHIYYYSIKSLSSLLEKVGLKIYKIEKISIHGGSIRVYCCKDDREVDESVAELRNEEDSFGVNDLTSLKIFFSKIQKLKLEITSILKNLKSKNKRIVGYGASGQSTTLLNLLNLDKSIISFLVDDSPIKIGCFSPGTHLEIKNNTEINKNTDVILVLAYTFFEEIKNRLGKANYLIPLPEVKQIFELGVS